MWNSRHQFDMHKEVLAGIWMLYECGVGGEEGFWDAYWGVICTSKSWYLKLRLVRYWVEIEKGNQEGMTLENSSHKRLRWRGKINRVSWGWVPSEAARKPRDRGILNAEPKKEYEGVGEVCQMVEQKKIRTENWPLNLEAQRILVEGAWAEVSFWVTLREWQLETVCEQLFWEVLQKELNRSSTGGACGIKRKVSFCSKMGDVIVLLYAREKVLAERGNLR